MEIEPETLPQEEAAQGIGAPSSAPETGGAEAAAEALGPEARQDDNAADNETSNGQAPGFDSAPDGLEGEELLGLLEWIRCLPAELYNVRPRPIPATVKAAMRPLADRAAQYPPLAGGNLSPRSAAYTFGVLAAVLLFQGFRDARRDAQQGQGAEAGGAQRRGFPAPFRRSS